MLLKLIYYYLVLPSSILMSESRRCIIYCIALLLGGPN